MPGTDKRRINSLDIGNRIKNIRLSMEKMAYAEGWPSSIWSTSEKHTLDTTSAVKLQGSIGNWMNCG